MVVLFQVHNSGDSVADSLAGECNDMDKAISGSIVVDSLAGEQFLIRRRGSEQRAGAGDQKNEATAKPWRHYEVGGLLVRKGVVIVIAFEPLVGAVLSAVAHPRHAMVDVIIRSAANAGEDTSAMQLEEFGIVNEYRDGDRDRLPGHSFQEFILIFSPLVSAYRNATSLSLKGSRIQTEIAGSRNSLVRVVVLGCQTAVVDHKVKSSLNVATEARRVLLFRWHTVYDRAPAPTRMLTCLLVPVPQMRNNVAREPRVGVQLQEFLVDLEALFSNCCVAVAAVVSPHPRLVPEVELPVEIHCIRSHLARLAAPGGLNDKRNKERCAQELVESAVNSHHPWLQNANKAPNVNLGETVRARLQQFSVMNKFKKKALRVIAEHLSVEEIADIKEMFENMDINKKGQINFDELKYGLCKLRHQVADSDVKALLEAVPRTHPRPSRLRQLVFHVA
ncbi:hypothetical protein ZIOFF_065019 [Zingiber officinale]|uniref:EF-hand domain-containing protein n=1 Tax=Zingiber officinale TaxID=94328 RepID=A0A8J5EWM6_ZINOF|nr:hypothetical protein ZIOFF_065019 [Zingiber officinale]